MKSGRHDKNDEQTAEEAAARGQDRFRRLLEEGEGIPDKVLEREPEPDEQPGGGLEEKPDPELAAARKAIDRRLTRLIYEDDDARQALERRRDLMEKALEDRQRCRVPRDIVHEAREGFNLGSISRVATPSYRYNVARELTETGVGHLNEVESSDGFLGFDMSSSFDDGVVRCDAWTGILLWPPSYGRLHVWTYSLVSYDYSASMHTRLQPALAYGSLWLLISRYTTGGRFVGPRPFQERKVLFYESDREGSGGGSRSFSANIFVEPQYLYVIWVRLYGKVASNKGGRALGESFLFLGRGECRSLRALHRLFVLLSAYRLHGDPGGER